MKEVVDGKKVTVYDTVEKEIKKDLPSRLHARKQMDKVLYKVTEVPTAAAGRKKNTKTVDLTINYLMKSLQSMLTVRVVIKNR